MCRRKVGGEGRRRCGLRELAEDKQELRRSLKLTLLLPQWATDWIGASCCGGRAKGGEEGEGGKVLGGEGQHTMRIIFLGL